MIRTPKIAVIVSAYSTGNQYAPLLAKHGYESIHITSKREWQIERLRNTYINDFIENIILEDERINQDSEIILRLQHYKPHFIIAGCESGVLLADEIANFFDVPKNDYNRRLARRYKDKMVETITYDRINAPKTIKTNNLSDVLIWHKNNNFEKIVIKPIASSGSDSVFCCVSESDITNAFCTIMNNLNVYNEPNTCILAQEYIVGDEYIVNTVSYGGEHCVTDIWRGISFFPQRISCDSYADLVYRENSLYEVLSAYAKRCLNSLGIANGPAHFEIKLPSSGPCIIEVGARLAGKVDNALLAETLGVSQLYEHVNSLVNKSLVKFEYNMEPFVRYIYMYSKHEGVIQKQPNTSFFREITSLKSMHVNLKLDAPLSKTDKVMRKQRPGYAYLVSNQLSVIDDDYRKFRRLENQWLKYLIEKK